MLAVCLIPWLAITVTGNLMRFPEEQVAALTGPVVELALLFGYPWLVLRMAEKAGTLAADCVVSLVGVQALIGAIYLPLSYFAVAGGTRPVSAIGEIAFVAWWLLAAANIFARSVDRSVTVGLVLSACHFFFTLIAISMLFQALGVPSSEA